MIVSVPCRCPKWHVGPVPCSAKEEKPHEEQEGEATPRTASCRSLRLVRPACSPLAAHGNFNVLFPILVCPCLCGVFGSKPRLVTCSHVMHASHKKHGCCESCVSSAGLNLQVPQPSNSAWPSSQGCGAHFARYDSSLLHRVHPSMLCQRSPVKSGSLRRRVKILNRLGMPMTWTVRSSIGSGCFGFAPSCPPFFFCETMLLWPPPHRPYDKISVVPERHANFSKCRASRLDEHALSKTRVSHPRERLFSKDRLFINRAVVYKQGAYKQGACL